MTTTDDLYVHDPTHWAPRLRASVFQQWRRQKLARHAGVSQAERDWEEITAPDAAGE